MGSAADTHAIAQCYTLTRRSAPPPPPGAAWCGRGACWGAAGVRARRRRAAHRVCVHRLHHGPLRARAGRARPDVTRSNGAAGGAVFCVNRAPSLLHGEWAASGGSHCPTHCPTPQPCCTFTARRDSTLPAFRRLTVTAHCLDMHTRTHTHTGAPDSFHSERHTRPAHGRVPEAAVGALVLAPGPAGLAPAVKVCGCEKRRPPGRQRQQLWRLCRGHAAQPVCRGAALQQAARQAAEDAARRRLGTTTAPWLSACGCSAVGPRHQREMARRPAFAAGAPPSFAPAMAPNPLAGDTPSPMEALPLSACE